MQDGTALPSLGMKVIGLAGRAGSGKSAVGSELAREAGVVLLDLDRVAWDAYRPRTPTYWRLVSRFGRGILGPDGTVDRSRLARLAFRIEKDRADLDSIVHPAVGDRLKDAIREETTRGTKILYVEGALLGSSPHVDRRLFSAIVWLDTSDATRRDRLAASGRSAHVDRDFPEPPGDAVCRVSGEGTVEEVASRVHSFVETL